VVSVLGRPWHSVAIDECQEMSIRIVKRLSSDHCPTSSIELLVISLTDLKQLNKNFQSQLFPTKKDQYQIINFPLSSKPQ